MLEDYTEQPRPGSGSCASPTRLLPAQAIPRRTRKRSRSELGAAAVGTVTRSTSSRSASSSPHPRGSDVRSTSPAGAASQNASARPHHDILANLQRPDSRWSIATSSNSSRRTAAASASRQVSRRSSNIGPFGPPRLRRPTRRPLSMRRMASRRPSRRPAWPRSRAKSARDTLHSIMHVCWAQRT